MGTIRFESDSKIAELVIENEKLKIRRGKADTVSINLSTIKSITIKKRINRYKADTFFAGYAILTEILGVGAIYVLFKTINADYLVYGITIFLLASLLYFYIILKEANKRKALFIEIPNKTIEIPINKEKEIGKIQLFFENNGFSVFQEHSR